MIERIFDFIDFLKQLVGIKPRITRAFVKSSKIWKEDIKPIEDAAWRISRLRGVSFKWKGTNEKDIGLIAEEVEKVIPEVVGYQKIKGRKEARFLDYTRLIPLLVETTKEQQRQIKKLNSKLDQMAAKSKKR